MRIRILWRIYGNYCRSSDLCHRNKHHMHTEKARLRGSPPQKCAHLCHNESRALTLSGKEMYHLIFESVSVVSIFVLAQKQTFALLAAAATLCGTATEVGSSSLSSKTEIHCHLENPLFRGFQCNIGTFFSFCTDANNIKYNNHAIAFAI